MSVLSTRSTHKRHRRRDLDAAGAANQHAHVAALVHDHDRAHGRQRPLARLNEVGRRGGHAVAVALAGRRKVVHLVVQNDAGAGRAQPGAKHIVDGAGDGDRVAVGRQHVDVRGAVVLQQRVVGAVVAVVVGRVRVADALLRGGSEPLVGQQVDQLSGTKYEYWALWTNQPTNKKPITHLPHTVHKWLIAQIRSLRVRKLERLHDAMVGQHAALRQIPVQNVHDVRHQHAGGRQPRRVHGAAGHHARLVRPLPAHPIPGEVLLAQQAAHRPQIGQQQRQHRAALLVQRVRTLARNHLQRVGEPVAPNAIALHPDGARGRIDEDLAHRWLGQDLVGARAQQVGQVAGHVVPVAAQVDGRLHQVGPRQPAVLLVQLPVAEQLAGHRNGGGALHGGRIDEHVAVGGQRRRFARHQRVDGARAPCVDGEQDATAQAHALRTGDTLAEERRDGGVGSAAVALQDGAGEGGKWEVF